MADEPASKTPEDTKLAAKAEAWTKGAGEPTPPGGIPRAFGGDEDALDVARGDVTDEDLDALELAIDGVALRRARRRPTARRA
jgi:hypothetical protein